MEHLYTNEEWKKLIGPLLTQLDKQSARRELIKLHQGPVKRSTVQCPWRSGEMCFATIDSQGIRLSVLAPNGEYRYLAFNKNGQLIQDILPNDGYNRSHP